MTRLTLTAVTALLAAGATRGDEEVITTPDVTYAKRGGLEMKIDIARPSGAERPAPAILCVHGGAWRAGSRKQLSRPRRKSKSLIEQLAAEGFVAASVSYRLSGQAKWPAQIHDCKAAVRFLRANAVKYKIDVKHIGAVGFSAGGHLSMLLGVTDKGDGLEGDLYADQSSAVQAVVNYFGPCDIAAYGKATPNNRTFVEWLGATYADGAKVYKAASPTAYADKAAPPCLFLHGTIDPLVPIQQSRDMAAKLKKLGVEARLIEIKGAGHGWGGENAKQSFKDTVTFFKKHLR